jgi:hypothetical protein
MLLAWTFSPPDYFEEPIEISRNGCTIRIAYGKAEAKLDSALYDTDPSIGQRLHDDLNSKFLGTQLLTHQAYELSGLTRTLVHPDGHKDVFVEFKGVRATVVTGTPPDVLVTDENGNVVLDSRRDRIERKRSLGELVAKHRSTDALLKALLESRKAAVSDSRNELVHLYEIQEALRKGLGGGAAAREVLGVSASQWSRMGRLCNIEPLKQGRHRGAAVGMLRDASREELTEAREIALAMIEGYLRHLESSAGL